jgi:hypothetical protein
MRPLNGTFWEVAEEEVDREGPAESKSRIVSGGKMMSGKAPKCLLFNNYAQTPLSHLTILDKIS